MWLVGDLVKAPVNKHCHNARTSNDLGMKVGPLKLRKEIR